jgi:hypothetical protein
LSQQPQKKDPLTIQFLRWLFPDSKRRRAPRGTVPGLVAFYFTGGAPRPFEVGKISASGLYLLTKERWAPETRIQMTLQRTGAVGKNSSDSIHVSAEVVSFGPDGVGFRFVLPESETLKGHEYLPGEETNRKALGHFLGRLKLS